MHQGARDTFRLEPKLGFLLGIFGGCPSCLPLILVTYTLPCIWGFSQSEMVSLEPKAPCYVRYGEAFMKARAS